MIVLDVRPAVKGIDKLYDISHAKLQGIVSRSMNRAIDSGRTEGSKKLREIYNIKARDVKDSIRIFKAPSNSLKAEMKITGKPLPIKYFNPRQTAQGVVFKIKKGVQRRIRSGFIATMASGHIGVFARGQYQGTSFSFRTIAQKNRKKDSTLKQNVYPDLNINEMQTISLPRSFSKEPVISAVMKRMGDVFNTRLQHELKRATGTTTI